MCASAKPVGAGMGIVWVDNGGQIRNASIYKVHYCAHLTHTFMLIDDVLGALSRI